MSKKHGKPSQWGEQYDRAVASELRSGHMEFRVVEITDGTETIVELRGTGDLAGKSLGIGYARRHKGDRRDQELGLALASYRALRDAADKAREDGRRLWPDLFPEA
ncbi:hypothetical protein [Streptomyces sp. NPDC093261]|uniref:hypothetical protein n=1 Tax=Streptomyces sp. NPDC093261 TaxID=3366037 RepID=UPI0038163A9B